MDDAEFERLSTGILDGDLPDWDVLERDTPPESRARVAALRAIAQVSQASRAAQTPPQPERWGGFDLIEPVGHGGYGEVWRAHDPRLDRDMALKLIPAEDEDAENVLSEGRLLARVRHPNVAAIYGAVPVTDPVASDDVRLVLDRSGLQQ